jgi:hypothetical protein
VPTCGIGFAFAVDTGINFENILLGLFFTQSTLLINGIAPNKANVAPS